MWIPKVGRVREDCWVQTADIETQKPRRRLVGPGWVLVGLFLIVAEIASFDLGGNLVNPIQACDKALPSHANLVVTKAKRHWPPPLVQCEAADRDAPESSPVVRLTSVTTTNVLVVAMLDAVAIAVLVWLALRSVRSRRRRRRAPKSSGREHDLADDAAV